MFAGVKRRSSNIRVMQLFHELKQQFPTVPDHIVTACITNYGQKTNNNYCKDDQQKSIQEILKATIASENQESMGQQAVAPADPAVPRMSKSNVETNFSNDTIEEQYLCDEKRQVANSEILALDGGRNGKPKRPHRKNHHQKKVKGSAVKKSTKDEIDNQQHPSCCAADYSQSSKSFLDNLDIKVDARSNQNSPDRHRLEMNEGDSDPNRNVKPNAFYSKNSESVSVSCSNPNSETEQKVGNSSFFVKRPTYLNIKPDQPATPHDLVDANIRPSERCFDIQKLLHSEHSDSKPPRSPLTSKRFLRGSPSKPDGITTTKSPLVSPDTKKPPLSPKSNRAHHFQDSPISKSFISPASQFSNNPILSPSVDVSASVFQSKNLTGETSNIGDCKKDCEKCADLVGVGTPAQAVTPLLEAGASVNLSLKVDCSMGLVQSPTRPRRSSVLNVTPELPWCSPESPSSQRSYTSVNLTLRPPSSEPQAPINITSQNSSLTYSTSSFDSQKGLQSRLQITVGPSGGTVSSVRTRPKSSYIPQESPQETVPARAGSLPDLAANESTSVISKQQVRIDRLRIELVTEKGRLIAMQREVAALENPLTNSLTTKVDVELEKQLLNEIKHLRGQCERLVFEVEGQVECRVPLGETNEEFYRNIYTGQRGPLTIERPFSNRRLQYQGPSPVAVSEVDGPKWNCPVCTFQNHPLLNKCEQCEMPRILHVSAAPGDNIHIHVTPRISRRKILLWLCVLKQIIYYFA
ncbi:mitogen-activated protein kinase kinase kinase 7-interacting protein 3 homolog isoform X2 [Agrilus planipennis]|uniref:Mitogen-activated protein kinase kinase kinase 7-interacting protein 3 homolog isoform X2 n=1 Tax=Agrilus planipennis TaxID=224129 RepID=A0A1W4XL80_AGRPL|nr:mitogen-activated protein kinase kinase kinase 7-interacting protein 3 homolog isoform X2 [Agrilus planipennis]